LYNLTKQEILVLLFICIVVLIGTSLHLFVKNPPSLEDVVSEINRNNFLNKININDANFIELIKIKYITPLSAKRLISYRKEKGSFQSLQEVKEFLGIKDREFDTIEKLLTIKFN